MMTNPQQESLIISNTWTNSTLNVINSLYLEIVFNGPIFTAKKLKLPTRDATLYVIDSLLEELCWPFQEPYKDHY